MSSGDNFDFSWPSWRLYFAECMLSSLKGIPRVSVGSRPFFFQNDNFVNRCLVCLSGSSGMNKVFEVGIAFGSRVLNLNVCTNFSSPAIVKNLTHIWIFSVKGKKLLTLLRLHFISKQILWFPIIGQFLTFYKLYKMGKMIIFKF